MCFNLTSKNLVAIVVIVSNKAYRKGEMMTRKDYKIIAESIRTVRDKCISDGHSVYYADVLEEVAEELADSMLRDNPRFSRDKFREACGL